MVSLIIIIPLPESRNRSVIATLSVAEMHLLMLAFVLSMIGPILPAYLLELGRLHSQKISDATSVILTSQFSQQHLVRPELGVPKKPWFGPFLRTAATLWNQLSLQLQHFYSLHTIYIMQKMNCKKIIQLNNMSDIIKMKIK